MKLEHRFVEFIPKEIKDNVLYISIRFRTVVHKCACGCGIKTVTPLSPTDWKLIFDGKAVSLDPSIGNWAFPCQSHYWIRKNTVEWSTKWTEEMIKSGREENIKLKKVYYDSSNSNHKTVISKEPWWKFKWLLKKIEL